MKNQLLSEIIFELGQNGGDCSPQPDTLCVNQLMVYDLHDPVPNVVHTLHPQHLILRLELFCHTLPLCHLLCQQEYLLRCLFVDVGKVGVQPAAGQKLRVQGFSLRFDVPQVPLPQYPDGLFHFGGHCQTGKIIVAPKLVP